MNNRHCLQQLQFRLMVTAKSDYNKSFSIKYLVFVALLFIVVI